MKAGLAKFDITPRIGVELCGFGPFRNRRSIEVREPLFARGLALECNGEHALIISCDLVALRLETTRKIRSIIREKVDLPATNIMLHCTHTHSGPNTCNLTGWGEKDLPYMEVLPYKIAQAGIDAFENLQEAEISYTATSCEGIGLNREYDIDAPPLEEVLKNDWRPAKPELTDTTCHVIKIAAGNKISGFLTYFGCHPVVCCAETRYIHGDYAGVAINLLEKDHPGSVGLFLQGAQGDVNSCVVHKPEKAALKALDIIAARFADQVRPGIKNARPINIDSIRCILEEKVFSRKKIALSTLKEWLATYEENFKNPDISDSDQQVRMSAVYVNSLRKIISRMENGENMEPVTEIQGIRLGPISLLASPFETFQAIKNDIVKQAKNQTTLVMGVTNDLFGYAPDKTKAGNDGYADKTVPLIIGELPLANIHEELMNALLEIDNKL